MSSDLLNVRTYVRTYVRMHIRTYVRTYVRTHTRTYVRTYVRTCVRTYVRMYVRTYVRTYVHKQIPFYGTAGRSFLFLTAHFDSKHINSLILGYSNVTDIGEEGVLTLQLLRQQLPPYLCDVSTLSSCLSLYTQKIRVSHSANTAHRQWRRRR